LRRVALEAKTMNERARDFESGAARMTELSDVVFDQIRKLSELHEEGILTEEEFVAKKAELLARF